MRGKFVAKLDWKVVICRRECGNEHIFERLNGTFRCIHTIIVWFHELEVAFLTCEESLDVFGGLVVHYIKFWCKPSTGEFVEVLFVRSKNSLIIQALDGGGKDEVGFVMI